MRKTLLLSSLKMAATVFAAAEPTSTPEFDEDSFFMKWSRSLERAIFLVPEDGATALTPSQLKYVDDREKLIFAGVTALCLCVVVFTIWGKLFSEYDRVQRSKELFHRIKDLGMPNFPITQEIPIFYNGLASVVGSAQDDEFDIVTMDQPALKREVRVLCWTEKVSDCFHQNQEIVGAGKSYKYVKEWVLLTDYVDSTQFKDKSYDQNKRPGEELACETFTCNSVRVGPYRVTVDDLATALGWKLFTDLFKYEDPVARIDDEGIWSFEEATHTFIRQTVPGKDTIGDLKVNYLVLNASFDTGKKEVQMSACGVARGDQLHRFEELNRTVCEHFTSKKDFIKQFTKLL